MRYDIVHPSADCYRCRTASLARKDRQHALLGAESVSSTENVSVIDVSTVEECFAACTTAFTVGNQCECGDIVPPFHEVAHQRV